MKFIVAADTQIGLYSHFSNIKDKSEIRTNSIEFVKLDFLNLKPTTSFDFEISNFNKLRNELNDDDWGTIRSFQATEFKKREGIKFDSKTWGAEITRIKYEWKEKKRLAKLKLKNGR